MKVKIISDLHMEFREGKEEEFINSLPLSKEDVLIAAGDVVCLGCHKGMKHLDIFKSLCSRAKYLIYVPGNHEYYHGDIDDVNTRILNIERKIDNMKVLRSGDVFEYSGKRFLGDTLWFRDTPGVWVYKWAINDPHLIKNVFPRVFEEQKRFQAFLEKNLKEGDIVITHHLPSPKSQPSQFANSNTTSYFVCDMEEIMIKRKPAVWIHGHTHGQCAYSIGTTRVISRPLGYPSENPSWKEWQLEFDI